MPPVLGFLLTLLLLVVVGGACWWAINRLAAAFGLPAPIVTVLQVVLVLGAVFYLVAFVAGWTPVPWGRP